ncbi:hypothetical protein ACH5RR_019106 [Cinchona calisaya]|uniref:Uncharacterized protein n=1 Tax=Cinchona calisaya TaxID=153742 RepID=A0ABD2ZR76_9GENT
MKAVYYYLLSVLLIYQLLQLRDANSTFVAMATRNEPLSAWTSDAAAIAASPTRRLSYELKKAVANRILRILPPARPPTPKVNTGHNFFPPPVPKYPPRRVPPPPPQTCPPPP